MKRLTLTLTIAFMLSVLPCLVYGAQPPRIPAWYNGEIVHFTVVSENVVAVDHKGIHKAAANLYAFGFPPDQPQFDVLDSVPGNPNYNPWWHVFLVIVVDGRDVSANPYTSEAELLAAADAGAVRLIDTGFHFLCQVLPGDGPPAAPAVSAQKGASILGANPGLSQQLGEKIIKGIQRQKPGKEGERLIRLITREMSPSKPRKLTTTWARVKTRH